MPRNLKNLFYTIDYKMFKSKCIITYHNGEQEKTIYSKH